MKTINSTFRIIIFCIGVLFIAFGVSLSTKADLGTSPISAIPYSLSLCFDFLSFGAWVIVFNLSLVLAEWLLLGKTLKPFNIAIQIFLAFFFGTAVDLFMYCLADFSPHIYYQQIFAILLGCLSIALGVCLDIKTNVSMLPGDGFVLAVSSMTKFSFGKTRFMSDIAMSTIALAICLLILGNMAGVREGTIISAIITGNIVIILMKAFNIFSKKLNISLKKIG